ncbi:MAG: PmoA family protein [Pirellula sp.]|nr:PmoA family protein [Pirellula sp.]
MSVMSSIATPFWTLIVCLPIFMFQSCLAADRFRAEQKVDRVDVYDSDRLVTTYHYRSGSKPILWPLMGPDGMRFSREYPMVADSKDEKHDHPHHRSLWMTFGEVNQYDLWAEGKGKGTVCQVGTPTISVSKDGLKLSAKHLWKGGKADVSSVAEPLAAGCTDSEELLLECDAEFNFSGTHEERVIDCRYKLVAKKDIHFGDTKEGMFAIRVPEAMCADKRGGQILTSEGRTNKEAWGYPARWVDYSGKVLADKSETYGIAILIHPTSYNATGRWHVRDYGLFAHNPFGFKDFPKMDTPPAGDRLGGHDLKAGDVMNFYYRVVLHRNSLSAEQGDKLWNAFTSSVAK